MTETELGQKWARRMRSIGYWVQKLPSSAMAGLPDWIMGDGEQVFFVEAKKRLGRRMAFKPSQLTRAQRFFLDNVVRQGGAAMVLVLDEDGFWMLDYLDISEINGADFDLAKEAYGGV